MNPILCYVLTAVIGYLIGSSNMAYYLAKAKGLDIHQTGTGNPGASNVMMLLGWKAGILVGVHDVGKAILAVWLCGVLFPELALAREVAGVACVLGHLFPFYMGFRGGKGFASSYGMIVALNWRFALALGLALIVLVLITDYIVVGTVSTAIAYPVYCLFTQQYLAAFLVSVASVIILFKHKENYKRILNGTEVGLRKAHRGEMRVDR